MEKKTVTEKQIGNTLFIVTAECSPTATETIEKKLEKLICRRFSDTKSYQSDRDKQLAMYSNQSEYGSYTISYSLLHKIFRGLLYLIRAGGGSATVAPLRNFHHLIRATIGRIGRWIRSIRSPAISYR